ncbi:hypothetical protein EV702DRAFT_1195454 [Suillus placidus]|uniref:Uncharacterized protein n=1 Tax=Suillus placidus TaxID=48579 RepID=A0A9P7D562_9AGAM|nr:hypothetical protein EV702DRAFT_1195454 [Suillus placidus]
MYQHLGIELDNGTPNAPITPPSTQNATASGSGSNTHSSSSTRHAPPSVRTSTAPGPPSQAGSSHPSTLQSAQQQAPQQAHPSSARAAQPAAPNPAPPAAQPAAAPDPAPPASQPAAAPATAAQPHAQIPIPADEIAALRARIAELERGNAHGNHLLARAPAPQQALVADPADIDRIRANLAGAKDEPKQLILPALQPGHKCGPSRTYRFRPNRRLGYSFANFGTVPYAQATVPYAQATIPYAQATVPYAQATTQILTFSIVAIPLKVEEAFKHYRYVPYTALTHAARSKAFLRGEDSSFVFTQDGLTAKGLDRTNELSIATVDWVAAARAAEDRTLNHWGEVRASALISHHLVVLDIGRTHGWAVAMHYDVQQRELAHANHEHNLAGLDVAALTIANNKIPPAMPQSTPFISPSKRAAPSDFQTSRKKSHTLASGHSGKPVAALATNARSKHALAASNGKHYCFNWANGSNSSAETLCMVLVAAKLVDDPRTVVTPLDHLRVEEILCKYDIFNDWRHIVDGIHNGFNVGITDSPFKTQLFREPFILLTQSFHNRRVHTLRAGRGQILYGFQPRRPRTLNWTFSYISPGLSAKTTFQQISHSAGLILPSQYLRYPIRKCWNQRRTIFLPSGARSMIRQPSSSHSLPVASQQPSMFLQPTE